MAKGWVQTMALNLVDLKDCLTEHLMASMTEQNLVDLTEQNLVDLMGYLREYRWASMTEVKMADPKGCPKERLKVRLLDIIDRRETLWLVKKSLVQNDR
jgi:hypothetical protein